MVFLLEVDYFGYYAGYLLLSTTGVNMKKSNLFVYNPTFTFRFDTSYLFKNSLLINTSITYQYYLSNNILWHGIGFEIGMGVAIEGQK